ncbi:MAG: hypothetical protein V1887_00255 [Candidatus Aenigmatarchaeota archaeon]
MFLLILPSCTFAADMTTCDGIQPAPSEWTNCTIDGSQDRVVYACDADIGMYRTETESRACDSGFIRLSITQFSLAFLLLFAGAAGLAVWKKRINMRLDK